MSLHIWIGFAIASLVMGLIPGPAVLSILGYAVGSGQRTALASVAGIAVGNILAMTLSLAGVGALLAASAWAFSILKWAGALYLIGLGLLTIVRARPVGTGQETTPIAISPGTAFLGNVAVGTFNPKTIVSFVAFAPQFISARGHYIQQAAILVATFGVVVACTDTSYVLLATRASRLLKRPGAALWSRRTGGGVLIAAGIATAAVRK